MVAIPLPDMQRHKVFISDRTVNAYLFYSVDRNSTPPSGSSRKQAATELGKK